ncbi:MAG: hypothetical protein HY719_10025 [Planctomycetes bacterium]|nr:hypothetical protein [Planctomycetota bacterium]
MDAPAVGSSLLEMLSRDSMHAQDIENALQDIVRRFAEEGIPFALIGALAMRYHGFVRFTEDIDVLTTREGLDRIHERLVGRGIVPRGPRLRKGLRHAEFKVNIDVIQAGEHAGNAESPLVFPDPRSEAFEDRDGIRVPRLETLIQFKLTSGIWGKRLDDLGDVVNLIQANDLDESFADLLLPDVRAKYLELLDLSRREERLEE